MANERWYDGMTTEDIRYAIAIGTAPNSHGGLVAVPRGFLAKVGVGGRAQGVLEQWNIEYQQEVESPAGEAGTEQPVEIPAAVSLPVEGSIGGPAPLPDTGSGKVSEVEGVDGADEAEAKALFRLLCQRAGIEESAITSAMEVGGDCWRDLIVAVEAAIECGAKRGQLTVDRDGWRSYARWDKGKLETASLEPFELPLALR